MEGNLSLQLKDGKIYKVTKKAAELSEMLKAMKEITEDIPIFLDYDSKTIEKILEYLNHYDGNPPPEIKKPLISTDMKKITDEWSADFVDKLNVNELTNIIAASHYIQINSLLNLCCAKMVSLCKGKTEEEIFKIFGASPDQFTPQAKEQIKENNKWVEDIFQ